MITIEPLGGEEERSELAAVHAPTFARIHLWASHVLSRVGRNSPVDMGEAVEAAHRRQSPVNRRSGDAPLLERCAVELEVRSRRIENRELRIGRPLEKGAKVEAAGVESSPAVAGEKSHCGHVCFVKGKLPPRWFKGRGRRLQSRHRLPPFVEEDSEHPAKE
ncbi:MAG: hypothetical protein WAL35_04725, partial [Acidimicrobiales bacterium]